MVSGLKGETVKHKKRLIVTVVLTACLVFTIGIAGCTQREQETTEDPYVAELYLPRVYEDSSGTLIQLTPNETVADAYYFQQEGFVPYNTYYVKADERGCKSCHDDLAKLLDESPYEHIGMNCGVDTEWTVDQCIGCHEFSNDYFTVEGTFATMIHGLHADVTDCWNCHDTATTSDTSDSSMYIWEKVAHRKLRGFTDIADTGLPSAFTYTQDEISDVDTLYNLNAQYYEWDYLRKHNTEDNVPLDQSLIDDWTITVSGEVEKTVTFNLRDLIEKGPSETHVMKWHCVLNAVGGNGIGQVEATGIPLSYLFDQAGVKDTAVSLLGIGADGFQDHGGVALDLIEGRTTMLVYEMNGEPLTWNNGYPCVVMYGGTGCGCYVKQVTDFVLLGADFPIFEATGWPDPNGEIINKPDVGIIGFKEGQVVQTGETITFKGYADAYDESIVAMEFSMDRGETWKRFDTPNTDVERWLTWKYQFTPEADGAYCFAVRAVTDTGKVNTTMIEKMFVAHSDIAELSVIPNIDKK
jgi:DMSO/TMAO reductase YedYZ molybdopterin-dependent catalytic subunit